MKPQIPKRLGRVSALAPQTTLCLCLCLHMYRAFALPQKRFSKLSTQLWPSWLLLPSMNAHCEPCACLFACDTHLSITSHSLQSISCLTNGNWGPELGNHSGMSSMTYVLKHPCYRPALSWTSLLLHFIFSDFFETGKKLLSHIGKETKPRETGLQHCHTHNQEALVCSTGSNVIWENTPPFPALPR